MIIGIDLDDTLIRTQILVKMVKDEFGITERQHDWNFVNFPKDFKKRMYEVFENADFMCNLPVLPNAKETLERWSNQGHRIIIITARVEGIRKKTLEMISGYFPQVSQVRFVDPGKSKKDVIIEEKIDVWIDDSPHDTITAQEMGIPAFLIFNNDTKWYNLQARDKVHQCVANVNEIRFDEAGFTGNKQL